MTTAELDKLAKDTGCEVYHDCLTCPLPKCILETSRGIQKLHQSQKHDRIRRMSEHMCNREVAAQLGISTRTVMRANKGVSDE